MQKNFKLKAIEFNFLELNKQIINLVEVYFINKGISDVKQMGNFVIPNFSCALSARLEIIFIIDFAFIIKLEFLRNWEYP
jgi:hypothetical protein